MEINGFLFFWLVVFAVIGILAVMLGSVGLFALFYAWFCMEQKQRRERLEYEGMEKALLEHKFEEMP